MPAFEWEIQKAVEQGNALYGFKWPKGEASRVYTALGINHKRLLQFRLDALLQEIRAGE